MARTDTPTSRASGKEPLFERALNSRVIIEQAKGVLAKHGEILAERPVAGSAAQPDASWVRTFTARQARTRSAGPALTRYERRTGRSTRARPGPW